MKKFDAIVIGAGQAGPLLADRLNGMLNSLKNCARSACTPTRSPSITSIDNPFGFAAVFSNSGGTALISTALATRLVPSRPI